MTTFGSRPPLFVVAVIVIALVGACGQPQRVGSERLEEFEEQEVNPRLGEKLEEEEDQAALGTPAPLGVGERPTPEPPPTPTPTPEARYFDVALISESPFYHPGNRLIITVGTTLRVTNRDTTAERPTRSFTERQGAFGSGPLPPGGVWTRQFNQPATYDIVDDNVPFARATLEVR